MSCENVSAPGRIRTCDTGFNSRPISTIAVTWRLMLQENDIRVLIGLLAIEDSHPFSVMSDE
jgi:hypothetical protein